MHTVTSHISALAERSPDQVAVRFLPQSGEPVERPDRPRGAAARRVAAARAPRGGAGVRARR